MWHRPPNFLLVDFYDAGNGSVFEVAASANGVTYTGGCCGKVKSVAISSYLSSPALLLAQASLFLAIFVLD